MSYKREKIQVGHLTIEFVPNEEGGLKNSYLWFGVNGTSVGGPDSLKDLQKLRAFAALVVKGKVLE